MTEQTNTPATPTDIQFMIQRVYVKNLSFETTNTPAIFQQKWEPEMSLDINTQHTKLEDTVYEVALTVTATVKNHGSTAFLVEVQQGGIFTIQGPSQEQLDHLLGAFCPGILFPYAREAITSEVIRGSFPQLVLSPINFDAMYIQQMEEKKKAVTKETTEKSH
jgi:preprotein translocase subunit SecB